MNELTRPSDPFAPVHGDSGEQKPMLLGLNFAQLYTTLIRSGWWVLAIVVLMLLLGAAVTLLSTPIYRATSSVQINQEREKVLGTEASEGIASLQDAERFLKTQLDVLQSRGMAISVAEQLNVFDNSTFLSAMGETPVTEAARSQTLDDAKREQVIKVLQRNLALTLPLDSRVVQLSFESSDPQLAARVANAFADSFIRNNLQRRFDSSSYARDFLKQQLDSAQQRLEQSERAAVDYSRKTAIVDTSGSDSDTNGKTRSRSLTVDTLVELNQKTAAALSSRLEAQARWERVRSMPLMSIPQVQENQAIQRLIQQRAELEAQYQEEAQRHKEDYPTMQGASARIRQLDRAINQLADSIRQAIKSNYDVAASQETKLKGEVLGFRSQSLSEQSDAIQLSILQREADTNRQQYDFLLKRYNELTAEAGVQSNNLSVVDRAVAPAKPVRPNIPRNMGLALLLGLTLAGAFVFGREQIFNMIRTPEDVTRVLRLPVLGALPNPTPYATPIEAMDDLKSSYAEAVSSTRAALLLSARGGLPKSIAFSSTQPGEGKSTTCLSLGIALARSGRNVLLLDVDLRRSNLHKLLGVKNVRGMSDILAGAASVAEVVQHEKKYGLNFVTAGPIPPNPSELLDGDNVERLLAACKDTYDCVLLDCPPVLGLADAVVLASAAEGAIYIVESGQNHSRGASLSLQRIRSAGSHMLGAIVTRFESSSAGYGGQYTYAYSYQEKPER